MPKTPKPKPPPSKYKYSCVCVCFWQEKYFPISEIREAVELLRCATPTKATGLLAAADVDVGGDLPLATYPRISFSEIEGKTLKQLMQMFDDRVDAIVERARQKHYEEQDRAKNDQNVGA
ncbi:MAG: hypothetical protein PSX80_00905 [bacterium]|nr:hypothetical protein [bacterium]